jgi:hypothetical protein
MFSLVPWWLRVAIVAGSLAIGASSSWWLTRDHYLGVIARNALAAAQAVIDAATNARDAQASADKITHDSDVKNAEAHQRIQTVIKTITREVPAHVTPQTDATFPLPCGALRVHDAAARGVETASIPLPAGKSDGDKCDVATSLAFTIIAENYATALGWQADLKTWNAWYSDQKRNYDAYITSLPAGPK